MRRRDFIQGIAGSAAALPLPARAQQPERMRRIGVLMNTDAEQGQAWLAAFVQALQQLDWQPGGNTRWGAGNTELFRKYAAELVASNPDVVLGTANSIVADFEQISRTVSIVFVTTIDPVGSGFVASLARPGGNATGFTNFEFSFNAKLLDLLKEMSPNTTRVAVVRDPLVQAGSGGFAAIQTAASSLGIELVPIGVRDADEIEHGIAEFARRPNGGLVVVGPPSSIISSNRSLIVRLAVQHHLPAIYASLGFVSFDGLISYGSDQITDYRRAASYVDRILKGEKPADLPVQAPTKYNLIINLKAAKAAGLTVPPSLLARADEVID